MSESKMKRRGFLGGLGALPLMLLPKKAVAEPLPFTPDEVLTPDHILGRYVTAYLEGKEIKCCYEARIHWASFERPTYGELIVDATRPGVTGHLPSLLYDRQAGECERDGVLVTKVTGLVYIDLGADGRKVYETWREAMAQHEEEENARRAVLGR